MAAASATPALPAGVEAAAIAATTTDIEKATPEMMAAAAAAAATWAPAPELLDETVRLLASVTAATNEEHRAIAERLAECNADPEFSRYLTYIFANGAHLDEPTRLRAGLYLKNNVKFFFRTKMALDVKAYIQSQVLPPLVDPSKHVRRTACNVISHVVRCTGLERWPQLVQGIVGALADSRPEVIDGGLRVLATVSEDVVEDVDDLGSEELGRPMDVIIPRLLEFLSAEHAPFRRYAVKTLMNFHYTGPVALVTEMERYIGLLAHLAQNETDNLNRALVCESLISMTDEFFEYLEPYMGGLIDFFKGACAPGVDEDVRLAAMEFWSAFCENADSKAMELLPAHFDDLVHIILDGMSYDEEELADLPADDVDDSAVPDKPEEVHPRHHRAAKDDDSDDGSAEVENYNLRKASGAALDALANSYSASLLEKLLPHLHERLSSKGDDDPSWRGREVAILALGAIIPGCLRGIQGSMPTIFPFLTTLLKDRRPLVRGISFWTLGRLSGWFCAHARHSGDVAQFLEPLIAALFEGIRDHCKYVQESAVSALGTLIEAGGELMVAYAHPLLEAVTACFAFYQLKNQLLLFDCIGTLADSIGPALAEAPICEMALTPVVSRWNALEDADPTMLPLFETMTSIVLALGVGFMDHAPPVYKRCLNVIEATLIDSRAAADVGATGPDTAFMTCALDLVAGLCEGLQESVAALVEGTNLIELLVEAAKDEEFGVRQSAFALLGELTKSAFPTCVAPHAVPLMTLLLENFDTDAVEVCNNVMWVLGEVAIKWGAEITPFVPKFVEVIGPVLRDPEGAHADIMDNAAISVGRMAWVAPEPVAAGMPAFFPYWMTALGQVSDDDDGAEKGQAFAGVYKVICHDAAMVAPHFIPLCDALLEWKTPSDELVGMFAGVMAGFRETYGAEWPAVVASLGERRDALVARWGLTV